MYRQIACGLLVVTVAAGCRPAEPPVRHLVLSGSRSLALLMNDIGDRFEEHHPGVRIDVEPTTAPRAINDTKQGLADLGMLGRRLRPEETGVRPHPVARDGVAIIVHRTNPVRELTPAQIASVFSRLSTNWKEVGGTDRPILVVSQAEGRAARDVVLDFLGLQPAQFRADPAVPTSAEAIQAVSTHPGAIGYASLGMAEQAARSQPIRLLPLAGVAATLDNVRTGRYPLVRLLQLLTREPPQGLVQEFLDFACSPRVHDLIGQHGSVPGKDRN
jgi:phosphate transport system substrate-binding protein